MSYEVAYRTTQLHIVASLGLNHLISVILKLETDLGARDSNGCTPLGRAVQSGERTTVLQLIDHGADPNAGRGISIPLLLANDRLDLATTELLIKYGALCGTDKAPIIASWSIDATVLQLLLDKSPFHMTINSWSYILKYKLAGSI